MADEPRSDGDERDPISGMLNRDLYAIADVLGDALSKGFGKDDEEDGDEMQLFELLLDEVIIYVGCHGMLWRTCLWRHCDHTMSKFSYK